MLKSKMISKFFQVQYYEKLLSNYHNSKFEWVLHFPFKKIIYIFIVTYKRNINNF